MYFYHWPLKENTFSEVPAKSKRRQEEYDSSFHIPLGLSLSPLKCAVFVWLCGAVMVGRDQGGSIGTTPFRTCCPGLSHNCRCIPFSSLPSAANITHTGKGYDPAGPSLWQDAAPPLNTHRFTDLGNVKEARSDVHYREDHITQTQIGIVPF